MIQTRYGETLVGDWCLSLPQSRYLDPNLGLGSRPSRNFALNVSVKASLSVWVIKTFVKFTRYTSIWYSGTLYGHMGVASKPRPIRNTSFNQGMINTRGNPCIGLRRSWRLSLKRLPPKVTPKRQSTKLHPRLRMYLLRASKRCLWRWGRCQEAPLKTKGIYNGLELCRV